MGTDSRNTTSAATHLFAGDEVQQVLNGAFYRSEYPISTNGPSQEVLRAKTLSKTAQKPIKPEHYKVICISMYVNDLAQLDEMVNKLKARGLTKANRSALIRYALSQVNLDLVPKGL